MCKDICIYVCTFFLVSVQVLGVHMYVCTKTFRCVCKFTCMYVCVCICICMYICMYVHMDACMSVRMDGLMNG